MISRLMRRLFRPVTEVPEEIALCEFDCSKTECLQEDWANCTRRLASQQQVQQGGQAKTVSRD